jgi:hypothetical protein
MMLKRSTTESKPSAKARLVRAGMASLAAASAIAALATGCLDRKLCPQPGDPASSCSPQTSNVFVSQIIQTSVDKIDLLFMIDNSTSMADKQQILEDAVPVLVSRLISPICVDDAGKAIPNSTDTNGKCSSGQPEFSPIGDIHIGIVSSSLGAHGNTDTGLPCVASATGHVNDNAHMIGSVRDPAFPLADSWNGTGFLAWDPTGKDTPPGTASSMGLVTTFTNMIDATGQDGCGYEAQLESWYRFLIDPEPPASVDKVVPAGSTQPISVRSSSMAVGSDGKLVLDANGKPTCTGCDTTVLAQRAAFLRPDSLVAVVMLSDENDCSITDDGVGWFVGANSAMPRATAACDANPNAKCCFSCAQGGPPPDGCPSVATDTVCKATPTYANDPNLGDNRNLRCYNQRKRFGFDLLYSTDRYVQGLTNPTLLLQSQLETTGKQVSITNPLYDAQGSGKAQRSPSLVFIAGIVGVPWQDIADDASQTGTGLTYLTADELKAKGRWADLLGTPTPTPQYSAPILPSDPFMVESIDPRSGTNPIINVPIVASNSPNPIASPINGHEQNIPNRDDLQYACTFKLKTPRTCTSDNNACDCSPNKTATPNSDIVAANSPLCQPVGGGAPTTLQNYAKGYPGARELQVLKDFGSNAIVASICPKNVLSQDPATDPDYGYNPAVGAIIERLKTALQGKCLPRPIETNPTTGTVLCKVIEAQASGCGDCSAAGRTPADASILPAVQAQLAEIGQCSDGTDPTDTRPSCKTWCECEINQLAGSDLQTCQAGTGTTAGYCYIDAAAETMNPGAAGAIAAALAKCDATQQQLLKFVDADETHKTPAQGAIAFIACLGAPIVAASGTAGTGAM